MGWKFWYKFDFVLMTSLKLKEIVSEDNEGYRLFVLASSQIAKSSLLH